MITSLTINCGVALVNCKLQVSWVYAGGSLRAGHRANWPAVNVRLSHQFAWLFSSCLLTSFHKKNPTDLLLKNLMKPLFKCTVYLTTWYHLCGCGGMRLHLHLNHHGLKCSRVCIENDWSVVSWNWHFATTPRAFNYSYMYGHICMAISLTWCNWENCNLSFLLWVPG